MSYVTLRWLSKKCNVGKCDTQRPTDQATTPITSISGRDVRTDKGRPSSSIDATNAGEIAAARLAPSGPPTSEEVDRRLLS